MGGSVSLVCLSIQRQRPFHITSHHLLLQFIPSTLAPIWLIASCFLPFSGQRLLPVNRSLPVSLPSTTVVIMGDEWNSSYIFGIDNETDWGERYFFAYYSKFGPRSTTSVAFELTLCSLVFVVSIVANLGIAVCIVRWVNFGNQDIFKELNQYKYLTSWSEKKRH